MALFRRLLMSLIFLFSALLLSAQNATPPPAVPARIVVPNIFSYQPPAGWSAIKVSGLPFPVAMDKAPDAASAPPSAMITVNSDIAPLPLNEWCTKSLARNKTQFAALNAEIGELEPFPTAAPAVTGFRAPIDVTVHDRKLHYVMYFFNGAGNAKLAVTCVCGAEDAPRYTPIFETAMKTFVPY